VNIVRLSLYISGGSVLLVVLLILHGRTRLERARKQWRAAVSRSSIYANVPVSEFDWGPCRCDECANAAVVLSLIREEHDFKRWEQELETSGGR